MAAFHCPACKNKLRIRNSDTITETCRKIYFQCTNFKECGATYHGITSIEGELNPSILKRDSSLYSVAVSAIKSLSNRERLRAIAELQQNDIFNS